jgi:hypothetical protein
LRLQVVCLIEILFSCSQSSIIKGLLKKLPLQLSN